MPQNKLNYNPCETLNPRARKVYATTPNYGASDLPTTLKDKGRKPISASYYTSNTCNIAYKRSTLRRHSPHKKAKLSKREIECLEWASEGKTSFEIATILGLSENTINNYVASVVRKMGASNRLHMVGIALRENYID